MPGKIPKPEERNLDETGFNFVKRCIEVLENRGISYIKILQCHIVIFQNYKQNKNVYVCMNGF